MSVAIVGGGVTGLTAAGLLLERGVSVTVYEAAEREGGLAGSFRKNGFTFDFGPHELCTENPALIELLREACGDDLIAVEKNVAQHFRGRYLRYPFEIANLLRNVSPAFAARAVLEIVAARARNALRPSPDASFEQWTRSRFGKTLYAAYFGPYTEKVWGVPPASLDASTAAQRISVDSVRDLLKKMAGYRLLGRDDFSGPHSELRRGFRYVRGGIGVLLERLRRRVERLGGRFEHGKRLVGVRRDREGIQRLVFADGTSATGFRSVIATIPLSEQLRIALGDAGSELLARNPLPYRGMLFVFLRVARPALLPYHWTYFPDPAIPFQRATEFVHFGAGMTPPGATGVALEVASNPGDGTWERSDAAVVRASLKALKRLELLDESDVLGWDVVRVRHAYPVQVVDYQRRVDRLLHALREVPNLVPLGRQGLFRYCNMDECMEMAFDVVPRLALGKSSTRYTARSRWRGVALERPASAVGG